MNLILVIIDSLRKDHVGAYGNTRIRTPNLNEFAKESVRFDRAYPESMPTLPFRNSTLTGRRMFPFRRWTPHRASWPVMQIHRSGKDWNVPGWAPIDREDTTLAEYLVDKGYRTALVTDVFHYYYPGMNFHRGFQSWEWIRGQEWDCWKTGLLTGEPDRVERYFPDGVDTNDPKVWEIERNMLNTAWRQSEEDFFAPQVFRAATRWLEQNYRCGGFFLLVDCFDPHEPWDPPQYYRDLYDPGYTGKEVIMPLYTDNARGYLSESELKHMRANYAAEVTMVDFWFGFFMNKVKLLGLDKNSIIVVMSDHGHQLGENNFTGKVPWGLMPCLLDLALFIHHPNNIGAGKSVDAFIQNHDLLPTLCNLMGVEVPDWAEGEDIWPVVQGAKEGVRDHVSSIFKDYLWLRGDDFAMQMKSDRSETRLYDLREDPLCQKDISDGNSEIINRMVDLLTEDAGGDIPVLDAPFPFFDKK